MLNDLLMVILTPAGALVGAYLASLLQLRNSRLVEAIDHLTTLLYDLTQDLHSWIAPYRIDGEPDKFTKGRIISDKLNLLHGYRNRYSMRLDDRSRAVLDSIIGQLTERSAEYHNALPGYFAGSSIDPYRLPEDPNHEKVRAEVDKWLQKDLPKNLKKLEDEFGKSLKILPPWLQKVFGR